MKIIERCPVQRQRKTRHPMLNFFFTSWRVENEENDDDEEKKQTNRQIFGEEKLKGERVSEGEKARREMPFVLLTSDFQRIFRLIHHLIVVVFAIDR